jgi:5-methylcytosine-specific restriction endonuclease McrA
MTPRSISRQLRQAITERANGCCEYCRSQEIFSTQAFSIEHIIPISKQGETTDDNLALACQGCNNHKYNKTQGRDPVTLEVVNFYHPRQQQWEEHFIWNEDYTKIIGLTPTGRCTVEALKLNRPRLTNLRRILYKTANHPP